MVDSYFLMDAMEGVYEEDLLLVQGFLGLSDQGSYRRRSVRNVWRTVLIAAILTLLLAACGYTVYRATMAYREPKPDDAMRYYLDVSDGRDDSARYLELNHGTCALALHFETEETGTAYVFRFHSLSSDLRWEPTYSLRDFFRSCGDGKEYIPGPSCSPKEAMQKMGLTETETGMLYKKGACCRTNGSDRQSLHIAIYDGPQLFGTDLIFGWPKGSAAIIREDTWGEYQLLEVSIDREWGENNHEINKHLFLFHPLGQYLLALSAPDELYSFEDLEAVAEEIEVVETDFSYSVKDSRTNWSIADYGNG